MTGNVTKLIIVDDEPVLRTVLCTIFTQEGLSVRTAEDGLSTLVAMQQEMPDVLLSDLNMSGMSGFELLSLVRRRSPQLHVVAMSGTFSAEEMKRSVPADCFYEKGGNLASLVKMVKSRVPHRRRPLPPEKPPSPLWVSRHGHDMDGPYAILVCPYCLGTFPQSLDEPRTTPLHLTFCESCQSTIEYALLKPEEAYLSSLPA